MITKNKIEWTEAKERVRHRMLLIYNVDLDDIEITDTPGYWQDKEPKMHKGHPLNNCVGVGCGEAFKATYTFHDSRRDSKGRFTSPYKTWKILKKHNEYPEVME